jgi:hypothetical protein
MRLISRAVKSMQLQWLPVLLHIAPPKLRREATTVRELVNCRMHAWSLLYEQMLDIPDLKMLSRRSVWTFDAWTAAWSPSLPVNGDCGSQYLTTWFQLTTTLLSVVELLSNREEKMRAPHAYVGVRGVTQLVTVVLRNKQCVTY